MDEAATERGGVMAKCKWFRDDSYLYWYRNQCMERGYIVDDTHPLPRFCPSCGKRVVLVDNPFIKKANDAVKEAFADKKVQELIRRLFSKSEAKAEGVE